MHHVYVLKDPRRPDAVRYVGVTNQLPSTRLSGHICLARKGGRRPICRWIRKLLADNVQPSIVVIESTEDRMREKHWLVHFLSEGCALLNCAEVVGEEVVMSAEARAKIGAAHRGRKHSPEHCARMSAGLKGRTLGRKVPPEIVAKRAAALRGKKKSPEHIKNAAAARRGYKPSDETRARLSAAARRRKGIPKKRREFCQKGHPLSGNNLYVVPKTGERNCRTCKAEWSKAKYLKQAAEVPRKPAPAKRIACPLGHPYEGDNLTITKRGERICRTCCRARNQEYRKRAS